MRVERKEMKKLRILVFSVVVLDVGMMVSCGGKKPSNVIIAPKPVKNTPKAPVRLSAFKHPETVEWLGATYKVEVHRFSSDSIPIVKDEQDNKYYDNLIRVRIVRKDGTEFFNHLFSKRAFSDYLDDHTRKYGALLGIVLDRAEGNNLIFGASVGSPDVLSDEYVPLVLTISRTGGISIKKDTQLDSAEPLERNTDEGV